MNTRCKPGDLAWIKRSDFTHCIGWLVEVVQYEPITSFVIEMPCWLIRHRTAINGQHETAIPDAWLEPHRPGPDEHETPADVIAELTA